MVLNDAGCNAGSTDIIAARSPEENCVPEFSVEDFSIYFHISGEIRNPEATFILPKADSRKKYCMVLKDIHHTTWPNILKCQYHDIYYNLNPSCEELEASVYNLVKFDTNSLSCKKFEEKGIDCMTEEEKMDRNQKGNICGLFAASPERRKATALTIGSDVRKFKQIQRCNIANTLQIRQIAIATSKNKHSKSIKGYSQSSLKLDINPGTNSAQSSPNPPEPNASTRSCRKSLFKTQAFGKTLNSEISSNMPADWSIKKKRYGAVKNIKPALTLNPEKCISPSNQNKYRLSLRKGLQRSLFLNGCEEASKGVGTKKESHSSSPERRSLYRFDSLSSEDMEENGKTEKMSDKHRKKLREAVANALESYGINLDHPLFKLYGRNLFSICKNHLKEVIGKGRTSIQLKKLADIHVEKVIKAQATVENL